MNLTKKQLQLLITPPTLQELNKLYEAESSNKSFSVFCEDIFKFYIAECGVSL